MGVAVFIVGTAAGFAYFLGAFDSSKGNGGLADVGKPIEARPQRPEDPIVEEILLNGLPVQDGFGFTYKFKSGVVIKEKLFEVRLYSDGQRTIDPFKGDMVEGFVAWHAKKRIVQKFDIWIAKPFPGRDIRADPVRISNIIQVTSN